MLALGDRDPDRYFLVHQHRFLERGDVGEFEQLEAVQLPLAVAHVATREPIARPERHLPADHVLADADRALDVDLTEVRQHARRCRQCQRATLRPELLLDQRHLRIRIAFVAEHVERALTRGNLELTIQRPLRLQRQRLAERLELPFGKHVESTQLDRGDADRLALRDVERDGHLVLRVVQLGVEGTHAGIGKSPVPVERLDAFEVGFEGAPVEVAFPTPREPGALLRLQRVGEGAGVDLLDAGELDTGDLDVALFAACGHRESNQDHQ